MKTKKIMTVIESIRQVLSTLDQDQILCDLPDFEFGTGGYITAACRIAGYDESGRVTVNNLNAWNMTVSEFAEYIAAKGDFQNFTRYEARLIPINQTTAHSAPLRWDGEKFREGFGFDAELFDTRKQAREILKGHSAPGFLAVVFPIEAVSA